MKGREEEERRKRRDGKEEREIKALSREMRWEITFA